MEAGHGSPGWSAVADEIIRGIAHDMNNRLLALLGVRELASDGALDSELLALFEDELDRLEVSNRLLRSIAEASTGVDVLEASTLLDQVRQLFGLHAGLRGVAVKWDTGAGLPALRLDAARVTRGLLEVLDDAGRRALEGAEASAGASASAGAPELAVAARAEEEAVVVSVSPAPADAACAALRGAGCDCVPGVDIVEIRLPSV